MAATPQLSAPDCQPSESIARPIKASAEATWYAVGFRSPEERLGDRNIFSWIRLVMPREPRLGPDQKPRSVIVMLNGFAEANVLPYDELMLDLARLGLPSILLPLPNHFSRYSSAKGTTPFLLKEWDSDPFEIPESKRRSSMKAISTNLINRLGTDAQIWLDGYKQTMKDLEHLMDRLLGYQERPSTVDPLRALFSPRTRLSLYGYSLGGLITECMMLRQPHRVHSAFLVNTGASLDEINARLIFRDRWPKLKQKLKDTDTTCLGDYEREFKLVFFRKSEGDQKEYLDRLHRISRRTLFLLGANDDVFPYDEVIRLKPPEGLTHIVLPAIGHRIGHGPRKDEWESWRRFVAGLIDVFEDSHAPDNHLDALADGLAVDLERLSPQERIRVKIALWNKQDGHLFPCGVSMNMKHEWEATSRLQETKGYCLDLFRKNEATIGKKDFSLLVPDDYGFNRTDLETYSEIGVKAVLCLKVGMSSQGSGKASDFCGVIVVTSDQELRTSILQTRDAERWIQKTSAKVSAKIKSWNDVERELAASLSRTRMRDIKA